MWTGLISSPVCVVAVRGAGAGDGAGAGAAAADVRGGQHEVPTTDHRVLQHAGDIHERGVCLPSAAAADTG